jgi:hypothetical protein
MLTRHAVQADDEVLPVDVRPEDRTVVDAVRRQVVDAAFVEPARVATHLESVPEPAAPPATKPKGV